MDRQEDMQEDPAQNPENNFQDHVAPQNQGQENPALAPQGANNNNQNQVAAQPPAENQQQVNWRNQNGRGNRRPYRRSRAGRQVQEGRVQERFANFLSLMSEASYKRVQEYRRGYAPYNGSQPQGSSITLSVPSSQQLAVAVAQGQGINPEAQAGGSAQAPPLAPQIPVQGAGEAFAPGPAVNPARPAAVPIPAQIIQPVAPAGAGFQGQAGNDVQGPAQVPPPAVLIQQNAPIGVPGADAAPLVPQIPVQGAGEAFAPDPAVNPARPAAVPIPAQIIQPVAPAGAGFQGQAENADEQEPPL